MKDKSVKRAEAITRNAAWAKMTPAQQLAYLDSLGLDAVKQRKKIASKMKGE